MAMLKKLSRIGDMTCGALEKRFEDGLQAVISDITDESKELNGKRIITLKIEFTPIDAENVKVKTSAEIKLAKTQEHKELVSIELDEDGALAFFSNSQQLDNPQLVLGFEGQMAGGKR